MALIRCPECTRQVSDKAKLCPHCGFPIPEFVATQGIKWRKSDADLPSGIITLVVGHLKNGEECWTFVVIPYYKYRAFRKAQRIGDYNLNDYATLIARGKSTEPPAEVWTRMRRDYGITPELVEGIGKAARFGLTTFLRKLVGL